MDETAAMLLGLSALVDQATASLRDPDVSEAEKREIKLQLKRLYQMLVAMKRQK